MFCDCPTVILNYPFYLEEDREAMDKMNETIPLIMSPLKMLQKKVSHGVKMVDHI